MSFQNRSRSFLAADLVLLCCVLMYFVDAHLQPAYPVKSALKVLCFALLPFLYARFLAGMRLGQLFRLRKGSGFWRAAALGVGVYFALLAAAWLFHADIDYTAISQSLSAGQGITRENILWVYLYISFFNSFLEEFFFRGFAYLCLRPIAGDVFPAFFSAACFSLYHLSMLRGWFPPYLYLLVLFALFLGGLLFCRLDRDSGTLYNSWIVHMFLNFGINTVGLLFLFAS